MKIRCMINLFLGIFVLACIFISGCSQNNIIVPDDIMKKALLDSNKYNTTYYEGLETVCYTDLYYKKTYSIKSWIYKDGLNQRTELVPLDEVKNKIIYVNEGNRYIRYLPKYHKAYISNKFSSNNYMDFRKDVLENFAKMEDYYYISVLGTKKINRFSTYHIRLKAKNNLNQKIDMWVDKKSFFTVKQIIQEGHMKAEIIFKKVDFSPSFPKHCFKIELSKNVKINNENNMTEGKSASIAEASRIFDDVLYYRGRLAKLKSVNFSYEADVDGYNGLVITEKYVNNNMPAFKIITGQAMTSSFEKNYLETLGLKKCKLRGREASYTCDNGLYTICWIDDGIVYEIDALNPNVTLIKLKNIVNRLVKSE